MRYISLALALIAQSAEAQRPDHLPIRNAPVQTIAEFPGAQIGAVTPSGKPNRLYYGSPGTTSCSSSMSPRRSRLSSPKAKSGTWTSRRRMTASSSGGMWKTAKCRTCGRCP